MGRFLISEAILYPDTWRFRRTSFHQARAESSELLARNGGVRRGLEPALGGGQSLEAEGFSR